MVDIMLTKYVINQTHTHIDVINQTDKHTCVGVVLVMHKEN